MWSSATCLETLGTKKGERAFLSCPSALFVWGSLGFRQGRLASVVNAYLSLPLSNARPKSSVVFSCVVLLLRPIPLEANPSGITPRSRDQALLSLIARARNIVARARFPQGCVIVSPFARENVLAALFVLYFSPVAGISLVCYLAEFCNRCCTAFLLLPQAIKSCDLFESSTVLLPRWAPRLGCPNARVQWCYNETLRLTKTAPTLVAVHLRDTLYTTPGRAKLGWPWQELGPSCITSQYYAGIRT